MQSIPLSILEEISCETSDIIFLIGPSGKFWKVSLIKFKNKYFFEDGWTVFVNDNYMKTGDFCVFTYVGNLHFKVQIFDPSGCEKEPAFHAICSQDNTCSLRNKRKKAVSNGKTNVFNEGSLRKNKWVKNQIKDSSKSYEIRNQVKVDKISFYEGNCSTVKNGCKRGKFFVSSKSTSFLLLGIFMCRFRVLICKCIESLLL